MQQDIANQPCVTLSHLEFSDGTSIELGQNDLVLIVGPNNAGKSATLRAIRDKLEESKAVSPVLKSVQLSKEGSAESFVNWLTMCAKSRMEGPNDQVFLVGGYTFYKSQLVAGWQRQENSIGQASKYLCRFLSADERLNICNPPASISFTKDGPSHPIHNLQRDDLLEISISAKFRKAFGYDLVVHRNAGSDVPLHVGERPRLTSPDEDRVSLSYIERLEQLPQLHKQGDGMRSFAGVLLSTSVGHESMLLIDEPEAFLHPPQAKLLGSFLAEKGGNKRQILVATHSTDIVRGVLDAKNPNIKVLRIRRDGSQNAVSLLDNESIQRLWGDPLLRHSNILDGLFHEGVVVCESDSDCLFYSAMLEAIHGSSGSDSKLPDLMFTHCGGKSRLPVVINALRKVDVPVRVVADFDILAQEQPLKAVVEALGADWSSFNEDWRLLKNSVDSIHAELTTAQLRTEFERIMGTVTSLELPKNQREELQNLFKRRTAWGHAKNSGKAFVPQGDASIACERLLKSFSQAGLYVVEVGEIEGFVRTEGGHGTKWVNRVLSRDLAHDPDLETARQFVRKLTGGFLEVDVSTAKPT